MFSFHVQAPVAMILVIYLGFFLAPVFFPFLSLICFLVEFSQKPHKNLLTQSSRKFQLFLTQQGSSKLRNTWRWERAEMCKTAATEVLFELHNLTSHPPCISPGKCSPCHKTLFFGQPVLVFSSPPLQCWEQGRGEAQSGYFRSAIQSSGQFFCTMNAVGNLGFE